jgi:hypothetical protein
MEDIMKYKSIAITVMTGIIVYLPNTSIAGKIFVNNENQKEIRIRIIPEGADHTKEYVKGIPGKQQDWEFEITKEMNDGKDYYSIQGATSYFSPKGTCGQMSTARNYRVTFQNDKFGTTCIADKLDN